MQITENHTIQLLIERCKENNAKAQKSLYQLFAGKMFAICLRYAKDHMAAEDILQTGFVKIFSSIGKFRSEGSFEGWLRRIMVNTAIEHYRYSVKLQQTAEITNEVEASTGETVLSELALEDLLQLIARLPDGYRIVFNMYVIEGFSHKEIAIKLGISEGGSKSQLSRAKQMLKTALIKREEVEYEQYRK
ncbi:MAG TPA: RNA polymerase sigma factor [Arachidicoccus sp.]|nr:RNA polymerase sigma factor [Arachidicoccus sp.]